MKVEDNVFIVTGGASGRGELVARMISANDGKAVDANMEADCGAAIARDIGGVFVRCDVSQEEDGAATVAAVKHSVAWQASSTAWLSRLWRKR